MATDHRCTNHPRRTAKVRLATRATRAGAPGHPIVDEVLLCAQCAGTAEQLGIRLAAKPFQTNVSGIAIYHDVDWPTRSRRSRIATG